MKKIKMAHIVNPVNVKETSDLYIAQPITFESMRIAKDFANNSGLDVELFYTCYEEDLKATPSDFHKAILLKNSVLDCKQFNQKRKLPILNDIINSLNQSSDADYFIYTNVDIAVMPNFYLTIYKLIEEGYDSLVINRRTISEHYKSLDQLPLMFSEIGDKHPGFDCFIFKKDAYSKFILKDICIGINWVGTVLLWNLQVFSAKFKIFDDKHLTFHIGNDKTWKNPIYEDYVKHNKMMAQYIYKELKKKDCSFKDAKHEKLLGL